MLGYSWVGGLNQETDCEKDEKHLSLECLTLQGVWFLMPETHLRITALSQERPDGDATAEGKTTIIVGSDFVQKFIC